VLFRLLRGAGTTGLAAIRPVTSEGFVRPLIEVSRAEIESWLRERGFEWREDSTNHDLRFDRNRIRHQLLPELAGEWNPAIEETLARMAFVAGDEEEYWQGEMERLSDGTLRTTGDAVLADCARLDVLPRAVRRRLIRRAIELAKGDLRGIGQGHVERILELAAAGRGEGRIEAPGVVAERSFGTIRLAPPGRWPAGIAFRIPLEPPARQAVPDSNSMICLEFAARPGDAGYNTNRVAELDWDRIKGPIELRNWQPGDRFHPVGRDRPRKLKELFQERRVPSWNRPGWPILVDKDQIVVWARTFGVAAHCVLGSQCHRVLRVWEEPVPQR
jgi:tRNA(Ile)-lysidine synthase